MSVGDIIPEPSTRFRPDLQPDPTAAYRPDCATDTAGANLLGSHFTRDPLHFIVNISGNLEVLIKILSRSYACL